MQRVFGLDVLRCPSCGGRRKLLASTSEGALIRKILAALGLRTEPPAVWHDEQTLDGLRDENSGGNRLFHSPGARMNVDERWLAFASVGVSFFEHVNGPEHKTDAHAVMGVNLSL